MQKAIESIFGFMGQVLTTLNSCTFEAFGVEVSLLVVLGSFVVVNMVVGLFWKGAQG